MTITITSEMIISLPAELRQALSEAAHKLDILATNEVIDRIRNKHPKIADGLQQLAREFRFEGILELLGREN